MKCDINPVDLLVLVKRIKLSGYAVLSYFVFTPGKEVWISYKGLKHKTTLGLRTLIEVISHLESLGLLSVQRFPLGSGEVNRYTVNTDRLAGLIAETEASCSTLSASIRDASFSTPTQTSSAPLSEYPSELSQHPVVPPDLPTSGEPTELQVDPQYLTLAQRIEDGRIKPELLKWLGDIKMLSPSGELDLHRLTTTFPHFQDLCSGFEQRVTEEMNLDGQTCFWIDGLNVVKPPPKKRDSNDDIINSLARHFGSKGV